MPIFNSEYKSFKQGWKPGANTLLYLKLNGDVLDSSGNGNNGTLPSSSYYTWDYISGTSGTKFYSSKGGGSNTPQISGNYGTTALGSGPRTISCWVKFITIGTTTSQVTPLYIGTAESQGTRGGWFGLYCMDGNAKLIGIVRYYDDPYTTTYTYDTQRHNIILTYNDTDKAKMFIDGTQITMAYNATQSFNTTGLKYYIGAGRTRDTNKNIGYSEFIIENKARTDTEVLDYYNLTKGNYGL